jgi:hypothetical protein
MAVMVLMLVTVCARAQDVEKSFVTGQAWNDGRWTRQMKQGFVLGYRQGYIIGRGEKKDYLACVDDMTIGQVVAIADKYVADHPKYWNDRPLHFLVYQAMFEACK